MCVYVFVLWVCVSVHVCVYPLHRHHKLIITISRCSVRLVVNVWFYGSHYEVALDRFVLKLLILIKILFPWQPAKLTNQTL